MTKRKNFRGRGTGQLKNSGAASNRGSGRKFAPRSRPAFKQQQRGQSGGGWRGNNNRDQGQFGLSYQYSQQKGGGAQASASFSSFFAPSKNSFDQPKVVELGLLVRKHWVGGLIGKKGKTIWMIRDKSNGANIDFGNDDLIVDRSNDKKWEQSPWPEHEKEKYCVCAISGSKDQASAAAIAIAEQLAKAAQSSDYRLEFLIPESYVGSFIGKKGTNLKQMKEGASGVSINIRDEPISLGGNKVTLCTLFGPAEDMEKTIDRAARWLGEISLKVQMDRDSMPQQH